MPLREERAGAPPSTKSLLPPDRLYRSPLLILAVIAACAFGSEYFVMISLKYFGLMDNPIHEFIDALMLVLLLFPVLIILVFRPIDLLLARHRRVEEELVAERNKLREIVDAIPLSVCIMNPFYKIEYANSSLLKESGPVEGRSCHDYFRGSPEPCTDCQLEVYEGKNITWEHHSDKTGKIYEIFETPLRNADGTISKLVLSSDITARTLVERELRASREKLRSLSVHLQQAREEERTAISREIHDELGQVLATVQLGVSSLANEYQDHQYLTEKIEGMEKLLVGAIKTVQKISSQLRPAILDDLGLAEAIEWQTSEFSTRTGIACTPDIFLQETNFSKDVATAVFRIFQEALTNVMRHSGATCVDVSLGERNDRVVLMVADNGNGITREQLHNSQSLGITGMRERAYALGGRVRICCSLRKGTVVIAHIPIIPPGE